MDSQKFLVFEKRQGDYRWRLQPEVEAIPDAHSRRNAQPGDRFCSQESGPLGRRRSHNSRCKTFYTPEAAMSTWKLRFHLRDVTTNAAVGLLTELLSGVKTPPHYYDARCHGLRPCKQRYQGPYQRRLPHTNAWHTPRLERTKPTRPSSQSRGGLL